MAEASAMLVDLPQSVVSLVLHTPLKSQTIKWPREERSLRHLRLVIKALGDAPDVESFDEQGFGSLHWKVLPGVPR